MTTYIARESLCLATLAALLIGEKSFHAKTVLDQVSIDKDETFSFVPDLGRVVEALFTEHRDDLMFYAGMTVTFSRLELISNSKARVDRRWVEVASPFFKGIPLAGWLDNISKVFLTYPGLQEELFLLKAVAGDMVEMNVSRSHPFLSPERNPAFDGLRLAATYFHLLAGIYAIYCAPKPSSIRPRLVWNIKDNTFSIRDLDGRVVLTPPTARKTMIQGLAGDHAGDAYYGSQVFTVEDAQDAALISDMIAKKLTYYVHRGTGIKEKYIYCVPLPKRQNLVLLGYPAPRSCLEAQIAKAFEKLEAGFGTAPGRTLTSTVVVKIKHGTVTLKFRPGKNL